MLVVVSQKLSSVISHVLESTEVHFMISQYKSTGVDFVVFLLGENFSFDTRTCDIFRELKLSGEFSCVEKVIFISLAVRFTIDFRWSRSKFSDF